jgi:imidazolonepropionase-like amidohydrolase
VLISLRWPERDRTADPADQDALRILEMRDKAPDSPAALAHAGVKFALYSGGPINPKDQMKAVRRAIEHGLSAEDALRAMTLSPAEMFGLEDRLGSIDKGKIANLVIADGDLFGEKTKIKFVFVDGDRFEPGMPDAPAAPRKDTTEENQ